MDERAPHSLTGTVDARPAVSNEAPARVGCPEIDGVDAHDGTDLTKVFRAIAARIDVVLDEKVAAGAEPEGRYRAARAWSSVIGKRPTDATSDLRRHALATTVLRISADGRVDVDDRMRDAIDDGAEGHAASQDVSERLSDAPVVDVAKPEPGEVVSVRDTTPEPPAPAAPDRSDVEERLRAVRERLATRRADAAAASVDTPGHRAARVRPSAWRRTEVRSLVQRLLIGLAIVGASAFVSILVT